MKEKKVKRKRGRYRSMRNKTVCVVGLGYVGLPLAKAFSTHLKTVGFDIDDKKIETLNH